MKQTFLLILAMVFAFAMPAQAAEVSGDYRPGYLIGSGSGDAPAMVLTDTKVTSARTMRQLEAAATMTSEIKPPLFAAIGAGSSNAKVTNSVRTMHEVGWRTSTPTTDDTVILIDA
jgi:hypothetical protein